MKRYIIFAWLSYEGGGWEDAVREYQLDEDNGSDKVCSFDTSQEVVEAIKQLLFRERYDWVQVVDLHTGERVEQDPEVARLLRVG